ncbi:hypothetical protein BEH94_03655 [Candidatus Altiarchaeales archaeon WOR_SM1_SCG]|nr:hypothetical protein BEH94_03655 [Candidatus Altiarchaeales archaeon WOR_SM1_SCG]
MGDKLFYIALATSIAGLILLTYASNVLEPKIIEISEIDSNYLYKNVHVRGEIVDLRKFESGSILFAVEDKTGSIKVFIYYTDAEKLNTGNIEEGRIADVIGTLEFYEDELEIKVNDYKHFNIVE